MKGRLICFSLCLIAVACQNNNESITYENGAVPPDRAVSTYQVAEGFQIELIASEPLIADPVDMEIDEEGNMYVVEMSGYPLDKSRTGKIKLLKDEDGDGVMDASILFAEDLMFPNGVLRWKNGILVTDAPYVLYLEDVDGDGVSDKRDTLLTGFSLSNPHVNVNNPVYGLDNWVYLSHFGSIRTRKYKEKFGDRGEEIRFWKGSDSLTLPRNANSKNVRFRPDGSGLEMLSVRGQFGHTFDEWGHHFLTHNQNHIYHSVLGAEYLRRNPSVLITEAAENVSDHGNSAEVYQITKNPDRQLFTPVGVTTSSSGLTWYTGGLFPAPYDRDVAFVAESVSNLVHVDRVAPKGATFTASRVDERSEFLASTDFWARPVNMYIGPDGALYVLDYYRRIIEHPEWMSDEAVEEGGLYDGYNMGRIYRISPKGTPPANWTKGLNLGTRRSAELVNYLSHKNSWWRLNAQRLLVARSDAEVISLLEEKVKTDDSVYGRLHALWTLEGMKALRPEIIITALNDAEAGIRENAIRIAEDYLTTPGMLETLYTLADDEDSKVRFQLLCTLGNVDQHKTEGLREKILMNNIHDEWVQRAAMTAVSMDPNQLLYAILDKNKVDIQAYLPFIQKLSRIIGSAQNEENIVTLIRKASVMPSRPNENDWQSAVLLGITEGLKSNKSAVQYLKTETDRLMRTFFDHGSKKVRDCALQLLEIAIHDGNFKRKTETVEKVLADVRNKRLPADVRAQRLAFLKLIDPSPYVPQLKEMIQSTGEPLVQMVALRVFNEVPGNEVSTYILENWKSMTPEVRDQALNTFLNEKGRVRLLLEALKNGSISKTALGWPRTVRLMQHENEDIRKQARTILTKDNSEEIARRYQNALNISGDVLKGREVFKANCSTCHQVRGTMGFSYGPDLGTVHNWLGKDLLANILDPGLSIAPGFDLWEVELNSGERIQGIISNETSNAIELKMAPQVNRTIDRNNINGIRAIHSMSIMPGFGGQLDEQELADLIAFLKNSQEV